METKTKRFQQSQKEFERANQLLPGGVNSPARSYSAVEGPPPFIENAEGPWIEDDVEQAVIDQIKDGMSYGAPTRLESDMAQQVVDMISSIDVIRFVNSGTEATMSALRLARGHTGRDMILKFQGCYHGHGDSLLVEAGSGGATLGQPDSGGVPEDLARLTLTCPYGAKASVQEVFDEYGDRIAGVILEPIAGNMGLINPGESFMQFLREITDDYGSLLIFDEVMTGFRVSKQGAQDVFDVTPDITTLGKIIGGGMPVGAYGGREEVMRDVAPDGDVYQAGTLSGNPVAMRAGYETLKKIEVNPPYDQLESIIDEIESAFREGANEAGVPLKFHRLGGMFSYYFTGEDVVDYDSASTTDDELFSQFHRQLLLNNLYFAPSYYESSFVSTKHVDDVLERACNGIVDSFGEL
ncbi:MAG: glutamate-1-semialdehyde 2,1-aminomutase [bacterium]